MTEQNKILNYPKSSCACYYCTKRKYEFPQGPPTNLSVRNCDVSCYYDCYDRRVIGVSPALNNQEGIETLNPQLYQDNASRDFTEIKDTSKLNVGSCNACPTPQYASSDPRLFSGTHGDYITLDTPPMNDFVKLKDIYNENLRNYGKNYRSYGDINAGDVTYYIDRSVASPYFTPLFSKQAQVGKVIYKDPMGAIKAEYPKVLPSENLMTQQNCDYDPYCLSWIKDSQSHRDDILTSIMVKRNQQKYAARWPPRSDTN